jgi:2-polyprenyl-3-methyl-5-hydroxy-6-metoxy-1,4-benzoquinol methylase
MAAVSAAALQAEVEQRNQFIHERLRRKANRSELKDLTDFMHDGPARLFRCASCGLAVRDEPDVRATDSYEEDPNDPDLMQHVYPRYVEAFRNKAGAYRERLRPGASVVEVGSHLGGFLQAAEEWNWRPVGLDIGRDTSEFARRQGGLTVRRETLEDTRIASGSADAVFIWNCFEQLAEPATALHHARRLLGPGGLLVVRVPNLRFYLERQGDTEGLAWNNLLGFPYLYGYTAEALNRLVRQSGFEPVRGYNSELVTMPFPDPSLAVTNEQIANSRRIAEWSSRSTKESCSLTGPWIEIVYRKMSEAQRSRPKLDLHFLERAA